MSGIPKGIHDGQDLIGDFSIDLHDIAGWDLYVFGKRSVDIHPDAYGSFTDVLPSTPAISAVPAGDMSLACNPVSILKLLHFTS